MKPERDPLRRASDKKSSPINNNLLWVMIGLALLTSLAVMLMTAGSGENIQYSDLLRLIKNENGTGYIDVPRGSGDKEHTVRFSKPSEIKISSYEVSGKVEKLALGASDKTPQIVSFTSNIRPTNVRLEELLEAKGIAFDNSEGPSTFKAYLPMLALTAFCVLFLFYLMRRLGGAGSPMAFGRSRGKMYAQED